MRARSAFVAFTAVVAALAACKPSGSASSFEVLDADASQVRDRFNADAGTVRVLMLVAPT